MHINLLDSHIDFEYRLFKMIINTGHVKKILACRRIVNLRDDFKLKHGAIYETNIEVE